MLRDDRASWSSVLIKLRNKMIHKIESPRLTMNYVLVGGKARAVFPTVNHQDLRQYLDLFWENLYQAVEETVVLCIAIRLPDRIVPCRISDDSVNPDAAVPLVFPDADYNARAPTLPATNLQQPVIDPEQVAPVWQQPDMRRALPPAPEVILERRHLPIRCPEVAHHLPQRLQALYRLPMTQHGLAVQMQRVNLDRAVLSAYRDQS